ncbi:MAG: two-component system sensor histidine kinase NtrB [Candidatus Kapaibacterium sp.]|jgi:signal transduction histidine kinase
MSLKTTSSLSLRDEIVNGKPYTAPPASWYRDLFSSSSVGFVCIEPHSWLIIEANDAAAALLGCDVSDIHQLRLPSFDRVYSALSRRKAPGSVMKRIEVPRLKSSPLSLEAHAWLYSGSSTKGRSLIASSLRSIEAEQSGRDESLQRDTMMLLGKLTTMVAHEIRNPLSAVNLHLQLLERTLQSDEKALRSIHFAMHGVERMTNLVTTTLDFAKPLVPKTERCDIHGIILDSLELMRETLFQKVITLNFDFDEGLPRIEADSTQLGHVFLHIIRNAFEALGNRGTIHIGTTVHKQRSKQEIRIRISDTGCGITQDDLGLVFNPFFSRKAEGLGLGLTTVKRIVEHHKGTISVESTRGKGTTFTVCLPCS